MTVLQKSLRVFSGRRDPDVEARRLKRRFRTISRAYERSLKLRAFYRRAKLPLTMAIGSFALTWGLMSLSPWPPVMTLKHLAAFPSCEAARMIGLVPAYKGQPGYWAHHDDDGDGRSCVR